MKKTKVFSFILLLICILISRCSKKAEVTDTKSTSLELADTQVSNESEKIDITIMAAASLTEVMEKIKEDYEAMYPNVELLINLAGSQQLATQIEAGVEANVFFSANTKYMDQLIENGFVEKSKARIFAKNELTAIAYKDSSVESIIDFTSDNVMVVVADETVPVGRYTILLWDKLIETNYMTNEELEKINENIVSKENNVKAVLNKVNLGEADAGIVYKTDAAQVEDGDIKIIEIPDEYNIPATYVFAPLKDSPNMEETLKFVEYIMSKEGQENLRSFGFSAP